MIKLNGVKVVPTIFPDGTSQVWKIDNIKVEGNVIVWDYEHEAELIHILQLADLLNDWSANLVIPYLPYARQDKGIRNDETFALRTFASIITGTFDRITTFDVHSSVARELLSSPITTFANMAPDFTFTRDYDVVIFPDAGAMERYGHLIDIYNQQVMYGEKVRDQQTGWITKYDLKGDYLLTDLDVIVVDDLCDGGATFEILAESINRMIPGRVDLYVSHGLFSKGVNNLLRQYDKIITTDTRFHGIDLNIAAVQSPKWKQIRNAVGCKELEIKPVLTDWR